MRRPLALLAAATALAATAGAAPAPALLPVALGLALVTAGAWATTVLGVRRVVVTRTPAALEAREHEPIRLDFAVFGLGRLPVTLEIRGGAGRWIPLTGTLALTVPRRGAYRLVPSELRVRDRLGIAHRHVTAGQAERLLILPAPDEHRLHAPVSGQALGDPELDGLEAYTAGTPMSRIHWPALARGAGLHARRVSAAPHELPLVALDTSGTLEPGALDWAARTAAGEILRLAFHGGCRVWLPGDRRETTVADAATWRAVHRRLALLEAVPATSAPPAAIRIAAATARALQPPPPLPCGVEPRSVRERDGSGSPARVLGRLAAVGLIREPIRGDERREAG